MPESCTHPIYRLLNPQPIRHEGVIVGAEGPCRCGENWARSYFLGQAGDYTRKRLADVNEARAGGSRLHGNGSVSVMPHDTDSNRTGSINSPGES